MDKGSATLFLAFAACAAFPAAGQFPFGFPRMARMQQMEQTPVSVKARCEPPSVVVGQPCAIVLEVDVDRKAAIDDVRVAGLPDGKDGLVAYGEFENLADAPSATSGHVVKRMRIPARFLKPTRLELSLAVQGFVRVVQGNTSFSHNFGQRTAPFRLNVEPLPEQGRPKDFSGAVGTHFAMQQQLVPDKVRPGDLLTATYTLSFDGYCPSNAWPKVEGLSGDFKTYEPKAIERTNRRVTWTQMLVPKTANATNSATVSINYYNTRTKRYETAQALPKKLVFLSSEAASTENISVTVTDAAEHAIPENANAATRPVELRFAPSDASPVIATLPPGTPVKKIAEWNGWQRVETPRAIGWSHTVR